MAGHSSAQAAAIEGAEVAATGGFPPTPLFLVATLVERPSDSAELAFGQNENRADSAELASDQNENVAGSAENAAMHTESFADPTEKVPGHTEEIAEPTELVTDEAIL